MSPEANHPDDSADIVHSGLLSGWTQMMIAFGFFVANWVGYGCQFLKSNSQFRVPLGLQLVPAAALLG